jgi:cysteate synthase
MDSCVLKCSYPSCAKEYPLHRGFRLYCDDELAGQHGPALLRAVYTAKKIQVRQHLPGVFQFSDWLPTNNFYFTLPERDLGKPFCYKSEGLGRWLGLRNLYIAFSGYWPEKGSTVVTRSFKEFEAQASIGRFLMAYRNQNIPPLIVASAGNAGNAYSFLTSLLGLPLYLVIPENGLHNLQLPIQTSARILAVRGDYSDAIQMAEQLRLHLNAQSDGGVRNIARRAGMSTVYLNAVAHPNEGTHLLFHHYFQAIGSGAGAIAAWEAVENLIQDGRFGKTLTRIHVAQNEPFTPIPDAWEEASRTLIGYPAEEVRVRVGSVTASVLANRTPAYSVAGGMHDVLTASKGIAWRISNFEVFESARRFRELEGMDISPAGAVAVGALFKAAASGKLAPEDRILLHITGGGKAMQRSDETIYSAEPTGVVAPHQIQEALTLMYDEMKIPFRMDLVRQDSADIVASRRLMPDRYLPIAINEPRITRI